MNKKQQALKIAKKYHEASDILIRQYLHIKHKEE